MSNPVESHFKGPLQEPSLGLSVVSPVYNERDNVQPLCEQVLSALSGLAVSWELVLVNDGSTDGTEERLEKIQEQYPHVRVIHLARNFGQTAALSAGFMAARGFRPFWMSP